MREVQFHPVTDVPEHVDFQRLAPGEQIRVSVAVHYLNEATSPGLKKGGVLNVVRHTVEVWADPEHVPTFFEADLAALDIYGQHPLARPEGHRGGDARRSRNAISSSPPSPRRPRRRTWPPTRTLSAAAPAAAPAKGKAPAKGAAPAAKAAAHREPRPPAKKK